MATESATKSTRERSNASTATTTTSPTVLLKTNVKVCIRMRPLLVTDTSTSIQTSSDVSEKNSGISTKSGKGRVSTVPQRGSGESSRLKTKVAPSKHNGGGIVESGGENGVKGRSSRLRPPTSRGIGKHSGMLRPPPTKSRGIGATRVVGPSDSTKQRPNGEKGGNDGTDGSGGRKGPSVAAPAATLAPPQSTGPAWEVNEAKSTIIQASWTNPDSSRKTSYTFDRAYGPNSRTVSVYTEAVEAVVRATMQGYHGSVFAYGQTSTGKTYTMTGTPSEPGIVPLAVRDCFRFIQEGDVSFRSAQPQSQSSTTPPSREYLLRVSYMEIYNEQINDLLAPPLDDRASLGFSATSSGPSTIRIFESRSEGVVIHGLKEEIVTTPEQVFDLLSIGESRRITGSTNLNKQSSRSHSIFRLIVESRLRGSTNNGIMRSNVNDWRNSDGNLSGPVRVSSLSLVDLAGSESVKATGSTGARQKEGQYINKSLMTLGHVVWKLSEIAAAKTETGPSPSAQMLSATKHIPYRDSKLTRILQPSLSGNAQICIICNVSPMVRNMEESHNTLKFASRAKRIKQNATVTEVVDDRTLLQNYREEIDALKQQLKEAQEAQCLLQQQRKAEEVQNESAAAASAAVSVPASDHAEKKKTTTPASSSSTPLERPMVNNVDKESKEAEIGMEEDVHALVAAIQNLEKLILKTSASKKKNGRSSSPKKKSNVSTSVGRNRPSSFFQSKEGIKALLSELNDEGENDDDDINGNGIIDLLDVSLLSSPTPNPLSSRKEEDDNDHHMNGSIRPKLTPGESNKSSNESSNPATSEEDSDESDEKSDDDNDEPVEDVLAELRRIQGLLGSVIKKKGSNSNSKPLGTQPLKEPDSLSQTKKKRTSSPSTPQKRDAEVEQLRAQLHEQEVATSLRKADSSFLQRQLAAKDKLLKEVSKILDAVEKRQVELERENSRMRGKLTKTQATLESREIELSKLKVQMQDQEDMFSNLIA